MVGSSDPDIALSVVAPVLAEEETVPELVRRIVSVANGMGVPFEVILVDDGSPDGTWDAICEAAENDPRVKGVALSRNFGQHHAISAGIDAARGARIVVMDGDLQDEPEVIPQLWTRADEGYDVVFVKRTSRPISWRYRASQRAFYGLLSWLSGEHYRPEVANFSLITSHVAAAFRRLPERARFYGGSINWLGFRHGYVTAPHAARHGGKASYSLRSRFRLASTIILSYSERPLRLAIWLGAVVSSLAFLLGILVVIGRIAGVVAITGWASLMVAMLFMAGVILIVLGIIGVYLGRVFAEVQGRPVYVTRATVGDVGDATRGA